MHGFNFDCFVNLHSASLLMQCIPASKRYWDISPEGQIGRDLFKLEALETTPEQALLLWNQGIKIMLNFQEKKQQIFLWWHSDRDDVYQPPSDTTVLFRTTNPHRGETSKSYLLTWFHYIKKLYLCLDFNVENCYGKHCGKCYGKWLFNSCGFYTVLAPHLDIIWSNI